MQHVSRSGIQVFGIALGCLLWGGSISFGQCMAGGGGGASAGQAMMGNPRMGGGMQDRMGGGMPGGMGGSAMMNMQQAMQMAQMAHQMRTAQMQNLQMRNMQMQRMRMMQAQQYQQMAQQQPQWGRQNLAKNRRTKRPAKGKQKADDANQVADSKLASLKRQN